MVMLFQTRANQNGFLHLIRYLKWLIILKGDTETVYSSIIANRASHFLVNHPKTISIAAETSIMTVTKSKSRNTVLISTLLVLNNKELNLTAWTAVRVIKRRLRYKIHNKPRIKVTGNLTANAGKMYILPNIHTKQDTQTIRLWYAKTV